MKKNKKYLILIIIFIILILSYFAFRILKQKPSNTEGGNLKEASLTDSELDFLLSGYPIKDVPLYKIKKIESSKYFINFDPINTSAFEDEDFSYYNIVFSTEASQSEFLSYYRKIFDKEIIDEYPIPETVKGQIGKYRISATHYGSDDTGYLQVHLPVNEFSKENIYFNDYPSIFPEDEMFVEHENSYGLLNQRGGQVEYTKYYTVIDSGDKNNDLIDDVDEFAVLQKKYSELYKEKSAYNYDEQSHLMSWEEDGYSIQASFSEDHNRIYLNIRRGM